MQKKKKKKRKKKSTSKNDFFLDAETNSETETKIIAPTKAPEKPKKSNKETGYASWYGGEFQGRPTANGEPYDMYGYTAAHKTLPLGSIVVVKNLDNQRKVVVRVNDRGPFVEGRIIDLTKAAADELEFTEKGTAKVEIEVIRSGAAPYAISAIDRQKNIPPQTYSPSEPEEFPQSISEPAESSQEEQAKEELQEQEELFVEEEPQAMEPEPKEEPYVEEDPLPQQQPEPEPTIIQPTGYEFANNEYPTGYTIQVGAFKQEQNAINYRKKVEQDFGKKTFYAKKNDWNYVWVGDFASPEAARNFLQELKSKGVEVMYRGKVD